MLVKMMILTCLEKYYFPPSAADFVRSIYKKNPDGYRKMKKYNQLTFNSQYIEDKWFPNESDKTFTNPTIMKMMLDSNTQPDFQQMIDFLYNCFGEIYISRNVYVPYLDVWMIKTFNAYTTFQEKSRFLDFFKRHANSANLYEIVKFVKTLQNKEYIYNFIHTFLDKYQIQILFASEKCWYDNISNACSNCVDIDWNLFLPQWRCAAVCNDNVRQCFRFGKPNNLFCTFHEMQDSTKKYKKREFVEFHTSASMEKEQKLQDIQYGIMTLLNDYLFGLLGPQKPAFTVNLLAANQEHNSKFCLVKIENDMLTTRSKKVKKWFLQNCETICTNLSFNYIVESSKLPQTYVFAFVYLDGIGAQLRCFVVLQKKSPLEIHINVICSTKPQEKDLILLNILPTKTFVALETEAELVEIGTGLTSFGSLMMCFIQLWTLRTVGTQCVITLDSIPKMHVVMSYLAMGFTFVNYALLPIASQKLYKDFYKKRININMIQFKADVVLLKEADGLVHMEMTSKRLQNISQKRCIAKYNIDRFSI